MSILQTLRNAHRLTRFVLVWFALFLGVAVASPVINPESLQLVCTSAGNVKLVVAANDGQDGSDKSHSLDCPLCLPMVAPLATSVQTPVHTGLSFALTPLEQARLASLIGLPWQARAPPTFS
jgi:hypothetical protein